MVLATYSITPARADIDPMAFHQLLPQTFIVGRTAQGQYSLVERFNR